MVIDNPGSNIILIILNTSRRDFSHKTCQNMFENDNFYLLYDRVQSNVTLEEIKKQVFGVDLNWKLLFALIVTGSLKPHNSHLSQSMPSRMFIILCDSGNVLGQNFALRNSIFFLHLSKSATFETFENKRPGFIYRELFVDRNLAQEDFKTSKTIYLFGQKNWPNWDLVLPPFWQKMNKKS